MDYTFYTRLATGYVLLAGNHDDEQSHFTFSENYVFSLSSYEKYSSVMTVQSIDDATASFFVNGDTTNPHSALIWTEFEVSSLDSVLFHAQAGSIQLCFATIRPQSDTPFNLEVLLILLDGSVCTVCSFCITLYLICSCLEEQDKLTRPIEDLKNYQKMDIFLFGPQKYVYVLVSFSLWKKKLLWDR